MPRFTKKSKLKGEEPMWSDVENACKNTINFHTHCILNGKRISSFWQKFFWFNLGFLAMNILVLLILILTK
jgi:hypothetical protein